VAGPLSVGRPELCVGAVAVRDGSLLLVQRATEPSIGRWTLPGGRVEAGESIIAALVREVREETGLDAVCGALRGWVERVGVEYHFVILDFDITVLTDDDPVAASDASAAEWVPFDALRSRDLVDGLLDFLVEHGVLEDGRPGFS